MIINVEFFDENPIENVITCLNYKVDKILFFGYEENMEESKKCTTKFLKEICGVKEVEFCTVKRFDLTGIIETISDVVEKDLQEGHDVFFDLTGGESLPLVAFGILSQELSAPMHKYDVFTGEIHEYGYEDSPMLSEVAPCDPIAMNLDEFVSLYGGVINYRMHKNFKDAWSKEELQDVTTMWNLSRTYKDNWVHYCALLRKFMPDEDLYVSVNAKRYLEEYHKNPNVGSLKGFHQFLDACQTAGFLKQVIHENGLYRYQYKNAAIKNYLWDSGSILEMYTLVEELENPNLTDCRVGVHIDWDGVIHNSGGQDVLNEIDLMAMENNLPIFISCKIGNVDQMALYELQTVANRFGGKYAKKVLVTAKDMARGHLLRAKEMGIEVRKMDSSSASENM